MYCGHAGLVALLAGGTFAAVHSLLTRRRSMRQQSAESARPVGLQVIAALHAPAVSRQHGLFEVMPSPRRAIGTMTDPSAADGDVLTALMAVVVTAARGDRATTEMVQAGGVQALAERLRLSAADHAGPEDEKRCLRTLTVRGLATIVTVAAGGRASHGLLPAVLHRGMAQALLSVLDAPQPRRCLLILGYAAGSLWQLVSAAASRLPLWHEEHGPLAALRLQLAIRLLRFFRYQQLVDCQQPSSTVDQVMLSMWLVFQMLACPMTGAFSRQLLAEEAADVVDCYTWYPGTTARTTATDAADDTPITASETTPEDSAVHRIRLIAACLKWDLAHAEERECQPCGSSRRTFCGPYTETQCEAQRSLVGLLKHLSASVALTGTQAAALASIAEITRTHPHVMHELIAACGLGHAARILVHAPDSRGGQHARLAACQLLHVVAAYWESAIAIGEEWSLMAYACAAA